MVIKFKSKYLAHASPSGNLSEQIDGVVSIIPLRGHQIKTCYIVTNLNLQHQSSQLPAMAFHNTLKHHQTTVDITKLINQWSPSNHKPPVAVTYS